MPLLEPSFPGTQQNDCIINTFFIHNKRASCVMRKKEFICKPYFESTQIQSIGLDSLDWIELRLLCLK
jgi:hypothetical protein